MKAKSDVAGYKNDCFYFDPCPLCYGCRNYRKYYINKCDEMCGKNAIELKQNVCVKRELHNNKNLERMILRPRLDVDELYSKEREEI